MVKLVIPKEIKVAYNDAFFEQKEGKNTLIGYQRERDDLDNVMHNPGKPIAVLLAREGTGKTALVEQWIYDRRMMGQPVIVVGINLEKLGEFEENVVVSRVRTLLSAMRIIREKTQEANPGEDFEMVLFLDEMHKLAFYGQNDTGSQAMNALKEETSRGVFPMIGATTNYEYNKYIKADPAFARRFDEIVIKEPPREDVVTILERLITSYREQGKFVPLVMQSTLINLVDYANAYIWNQANPAKAIAMLNIALGFCDRLHSLGEGGEVLDHSILRDTFLTKGIDIDDVKPNEVKLIIPPELEKKYNYALKQLPNGDNTLIGYEEQLEMLDASMLDAMQPNAMLLAPAGAGKTATVEQWGYLRSQTKKPVAIVSLEVETLGELGSEKMVARMRTLLSDLNNVKKTTQEANPNTNFDMVLFIDEIHKLYNYGSQADGDLGSSGAMNALKEGMARGQFPIIGATTDYEYRQYIVPDLAFDRRFGKVILDPPTPEDTVEILNRRVKSIKEKGNFVPKISRKILFELVGYADSFIRNQVNPAKSLAILGKALGYCAKENIKDSTKGLELSHEHIKKAFFAEGYTIDTNATPEHVFNVVSSRIKGQPLAINQIVDVINTSIYSKRNFKRPLLTAFFDGTTGVGKTELAKALALAYFGSSDALLVMNGGDYVTKESAIQAQHFIGDAMAVNKRQLILLDEIEKSDKSVMDSYMRMIDDGIVRDSHNIERSINSTIVIATSNLGATIFSELSNNMHLHRLKDPDVLTPGLDEEWYRKDQEVRKALQAGDPGLNNGIKPEFLERFSLFVPFLPLSRKTMANIARMQLEKFRDEMKDAPYPINIALPRKEPSEFWQYQMSTTETPYSDNDKLSVMIAEDIIGSEAQTNGARSVSRFINGRVKTKVMRLLAYRIKNNLPVDGQFRLEALNPSYESNEGLRPDVNVVYVPVEDL